MVVQTKTPAEIAQSASVSLPVVPPGIASVTIAPAGTVDTPAFVSVIVYVVDVPAVTDPTPSSTVTARSPATATVVASVSSSFAPFGSVELEETLTVFVRSATRAGSTWTVT